MFWRIILVVLAIINISLIIALIWGAQTVLGRNFQLAGAVEPSYWDVSNFFFTGTDLSFPDVPANHAGYVETNILKQFIGPGSAIVSGIRGLVWFVLIQGIAQLIMAIALGFTGAISVNMPQGGGRRRR
jgi:hypothetical protein